MFINNSISKPKNKMMSAPIHKKGPNGTIWVFLLFKITNEIGSPTIEPKNIVKIAFIYPKTSPKTNINFISPPPIDSFLKQKSPIFFIIYIVRKAQTPLIK